MPNLFIGYNEIYSNIEKINTVLSSYANISYSSYNLKSDTLFKILRLLRRLRG